MIAYKVNTDFRKNTGFDITYDEILKAVNQVNHFLCSLPPALFKSVDFKTTGAMIGAIFCSKIEEQIPEAAVNPIEKGHPDIIPRSGLESAEETLRKYPTGIEIKGTIGNIRKGTNLRAGAPRIDALDGITWQAHHREVTCLLGIIWDFINEQEGFYHPAITGVFFSDQLEQEDWGEISGTTGRNTKVSGMRASGKQKMGAGAILLFDNELHIQKYSRLLKIKVFPGI